MKRPSCQGSKVRSRGEDSDSTAGHEGEEAEDEFPRVFDQCASG